MSECTHELSDVAHATIVLHARAHATNVSGVLLGTRSAQRVRIGVALPLAHSDLAMLSAPLHELSLLLAERYAAQHALQLLGVYHANALLADRSVGALPTALANAVHTRAHSALVLQLSVDHHHRHRAHSLRLFARHHEPVRGTWRSSELPARWLSLQTDAPALLRALSRRRASELALRVADFEDHCNDPRRDWLNVALRQRLQALQM